MAQVRNQRECSQRKAEIDAWGEHLRGSNAWRGDDGEWQQLAEEDIATLRGLTWQRPSPA
jgi:hypothetical protein